MTLEAFSVTRKRVNGNLSPVASRGFVNLRGVRLTLFTLNEVRLAHSPMEKT